MIKGGGRYDDYPAASREPLISGGNRPMSPTSPMARSASKSNAGRRGQSQRTKRRSSFYGRDDVPASMGLPRPSSAFSRPGDMASPTSSVPIDMDQRGQRSKKGKTGFRFGNFGRRKAAKSMLRPVLSQAQREALLGADKPFKKSFKHAFKSWYNGEMDDDEALLHSIERINRKETHNQRMRELKFYLPFMGLFIVWCLLWRNFGGGYFVAHGPKDLLVDTAFKTSLESAPVTYFDISSHGDWFDWMESLVIPTLFEDETYNGYPIDRSVRMLGGANQLVGAVRIRTWRSKPGECENLYDDRTPCYAPQSGGSKQTTPFGDVSPTNFENTIECGQSGVEYGVFTFDHMEGSYDCTSAWVDIPYNDTQGQALSRLAVMKAGSFLDGYSRGVAVEIFTNNPFYRAWVSTRLFVEFTAGGVVQPEIKTDLFRVAILSDFGDYFGIIVLGVMYGYLVFLTYLLWKNLMTDIKFKGKRVKTVFVFFAGWNGIEVLSLMLFTAGGILRIIWGANTDRTKYASGEWRDAMRDEYPPLSVVRNLWVREREIAAYNSGLVLLRLFKYINTNPRLNLLTRTLSRAAATSVGLILILLITLLSFATMGMLYYSNTVKEFTQFDSVVSVLLRVLVGDVEIYPSLREVNPAFTNIYLVTYAILAFMVILSMVLALIVDAFQQEVKENLGADPLWTQFRKRMNQFSWFRNIIPYTKITYNDISPYHVFDQLFLFRQNSGRSTATLDDLQRILGCSRTDAMIIMKHLTVERTGTINLDKLEVLQACFEEVPDYSWIDESTDDEDSEDEEPPSRTSTGAARWKSTSQAVIGGLRMKNMSNKTKANIESEFEGAFGVTTPEPSGETGSGMPSVVAALTQGNKDSAKADSGKGEEVKPKPDSPGSKMSSETKNKFRKSLLSHVKEMKEKTEAEEGGGGQGESAGGTEGSSQGAGPSSAPVEQAKPRSSSLGPGGASEEVTAENAAKIGNVLAMLSGGGQPKDTTGKAVNNFLASTGKKRKGSSLATSVMADDEDDDLTSLQGKRRHSRAASSAGTSNAADNSTKKVEGGVSNSSLLRVARELGSVKDAVVTMGTAIDGHLSVPKPTHLNASCQTDMELVNRDVRVSRPKPRGHKVRTYYPQGDCKAEQSNSDEDRDHWGNMPMQCQNHRRYPVNFHKQEGEKSGWGCCLIDVMGRLSRQLEAQHDFMELRFEEQDAAQSALTQHWLEQTQRFIHSGKHLGGDDTVFQENFDSRMIEIGRMLSRLQTAADRSSRDIAELKTATSRAIRKAHVAPPAPPPQPPPRPPSLAPAAENDNGSNGSGQRSQIGAWSEGVELPANSPAPADHSQGSSPGMGRPWSLSLEPQNAPGMKRVRQSDGKPDERQKQALQNAVKALRKKTPPRTPSPRAADPSKEEYTKPDSGRVHSGHHAMSSDLAAILRNY